MNKNQNIIGFDAHFTGRCNTCDEKLTKDEIDEFGTVCYPCDATPDFVGLYANINEPYEDL